MKDYDILVVGSGFVGGIISFLSAKDGKKVLLLEQRNHIAGNMYDYIDQETDLLVQRYGPHAFHTESEKAFAFVVSNGDWFPYYPTARVEMLGKLTPSPFNINTIETFFPLNKAIKIQKHLMDVFKGVPKVTISEMLSCDDSVVREYAEFLFENDYRHYTSKQWGIAPEMLDISIINRVPIRLNNLDSCQDDRYQIMPVGGYTEYFKKILTNPLIDIRLNTNALQHIKVDTKNGEMLFNGEKINIPVVYTGTIDALFAFAFGKLPYRSLRFNMVVMEKESFGETPIIAYPKADGYTRTVEYTKFPRQVTNGKTIVVYEYPEEYDYKNEPYYPTITENSKLMYEKYEKAAKRIHNLHLGGRLADFKYYNMDQAVLRALELYEGIKDERYTNNTRPIC